MTARASITITLVIGAQSFRSGLDRVAQFAADDKAWIPSAIQPVHRVR